MKKIIFVLFVFALVLMGANAAWAPVSIVTEESDPSDDSSSNNDTSVVDLSDVTDDTVYSPSLDNQ